MTEQKIIKRYISQKAVGHNPNYVQLECVVEYLDGTIKEIVEFRKKK